MRIAYVCYLATLADSGVTSKLVLQAGTWLAEGHDVRVFCLARYERLEGEPLVAAALGPALELFPFGSAVGRPARTLALARRVRRFAPDVVYVRYDLFAPPLGLLLHGRRVVTEVNTADRAELALRGSRAASYNELNRRSLLGGSAGLVFVSHELARSPDFAGFPAALRVVVANGADLAGLPRLPPGGDGPLRFGFLGYPAPWQGLDKALRLAELLPETRLEVIGPFRAEAAPSNVTFHGALGRAALEPILARCDVALGTLALHRKGLNEASPLKVREFLAYGLPAVIGYRDTDFLDAEPWFLLRVPNDESGVERSIERIAAFAEGVRGRRVERDEVARLDAVEKERRRLAFLETVATSGRGA